MKCRNCGAEMARGTTEQTFERDGFGLTVTDIPADVCPNGDEAYVNGADYQVVEQMFALAKQYRVRAGRQSFAGRSSKRDSGFSLTALPPRVVVKSSADEPEPHTDTFEFDNLDDAHAFMGSAFVRAK